MEKPFYKSKKFVYALATFIAALVLAVLPSIVTLEPETVDMLETTLPAVLGIGILVITGHGIQDALTTVKGLQIMSLSSAFAELIEATPLAEREPETLAGQ